MEKIIDRYISFLFENLIDTTSIKQNKKGIREFKLRRSDGFFIYCNFNHHRTKYCLCINQKTYLSIQNVLGICNEDVQKGIIKWMKNHLEIKIDKVVIPIDN